MARINVDLPAPFGPSSASQPPPGTAQLTPCSTGTRSRVTVTPSAASAVMPAPPLVVRVGRSLAGPCQVPTLLVPRSTQTNAGAPTSAVTTPIGSSAGA